MLSGHDLLAFVGALALVLLVGRVAGELARRLGQPEVLGLFAAGVLLGPSALGKLLPGVQHAMFQQTTNASALSGLSNIGALFLLLAAGMEVDLRILRGHIRPGLLVAGAAIVPSLFAGALVGRHLGAESTSAAVYVGVVLSVTAISVLSTLLFEAGAERRNYAQVLLVAGVTAEMACWLLVSAFSRGHGPALLDGARSLGLAAAFFLAAAIVGRRLVPAVMRVAADRTTIPFASFTAVLALMFAFGTATDALGLHPLLGAFVLGILLRRAPRTGAALANPLANVTRGLFAPLFFVLAGAQVDVTRVASLSSLFEVLGLLVLATLVKVVPVAAGARAGGLARSESLLVGVGMNAKGGTDVLVAIVGQQLGVLSVALYTQYSVVAFLTVLFTPGLLRLLQHRAPPSDDERRRLDLEESERRSYLAHLQRVLVPMMPDLRPGLAADVLHRLTTTSQAHGHLVDVTQLRVHGGAEGRHTSAEHGEANEHGEAKLSAAGEEPGVHLRGVTADPAGDVVEQIVAASAGQDLVALGATLDAEHSGVLSALQSGIIDNTSVDVLVAACDAQQFPWPWIRRILVPTNGASPALAGAEIAGRLAESCGADVVLLTVVDPAIRPAVERRPAGPTPVAPGTGHLRDARSVLRAMPVEVHERVREGRAETEVLDELRSGDYDLLVMGCRDQPGDGFTWFGPTAESVIAHSRSPYVILVNRTTFTPPADGRQAEGPAERDVAAARDR